jgi:hypothetical protein
VSNRRLNQEELAEANKVLKSIRDNLVSLSDGDADLLFAYRRKIFKELNYDERSKSATCKRLKQFKFKQQSGKCALGSEPLSRNNAVLERFSAALGYVSENTRLICTECDQHARQATAQLTKNKNAHFESSKDSRFLESS